MATDKDKIPEQEQYEVISRRTVGKKAAYVVPAVLAVILAADRPTPLAASTTGPPM